MASLADAYKPSRRAGMEHSPRPMNPWPVVDRAAASLAQYIPSPTQGRRMSMDEDGNVYGSTAEENQLSSLVDFLAGTGAAPTVLGRMEPGVLNALGGKVGGKPASVIKDWKWRPEAEVQADLGLTSIPEHVQDFGRFMEDMAMKAKRGEMSPRDLVKAYTITRSSIQRQAQNTEKLRERWPDFPAAEGQAKVRPEGAFSEWLFTPHGQAYLNAAQEGRAEMGAIQDAVDKLGGYGKGNDLAAALVEGANLPGQEQHVADMVALAYGKPGSVNNDWRAWTKELPGIGPAKSGFLGSLLGKGDLPTLDARQLLLHTGRPTSEASAYLARKGGLGGIQAVDRLAARQKRMGLDLPEELQPFYQHLAHHAVWDKYGNEITTHDDLKRAMRLAAQGGAAVLPVAGSLSGYLSDDYQ